MTETLAMMYAAGLPVDFEAFHGGRRGPWDDVPLYPLEHQRYWLDDSPPQQEEPAAILTFAAE